MKIWDIKSEQLSTELEFPGGSFEISSIVHPSSYMNKILLGSTQGSLQVRSIIIVIEYFVVTYLNLFLQLWNIKTCKKIHKFKGWGSAVLCLEQAPAIDVIAVGLKSGEIYVHNIKFDETIVKFR